MKIEMKMKMLAEKAKSAEIGNYYTWENVYLDTTWTLTQSQNFQEDFGIYLPLTVFHLNVWVGKCLTPETISVETVHKINIFNKPHHERIQRSIFSQSFVTVDSSLILISCAEY